ncbi:hypothetical protein ABKV19_026617, partial [Rosa sericea]
MGFIQRADDAIWDLPAGSPILVWYLCDRLYKMYKSQFIGGQKEKFVRCAPKVFQLRMVSGQISLAGRSAAYCCLWQAEEYHHDHWHGWK